MITYIHHLFNRKKVRLTEKGMTCQKVKNRLEGVGSIYGFVLHIDCLTTGVLLLHDYFSLNCDIFLVCFSCNFLSLHMPRITFVWTAILCLYQVGKGIPLFWIHLSKEIHIKCNLSVFWSNGVMMSSSPQKLSFELWATHFF